MAIQIILTTRKDGADVATCGDLSAEHPRASVLRILARKLVEAGAVEQPWVAIRAGGAVLYGPSLHRLAAYDVRDGETRISETRWRAHPSAPQPALEATLNLAVAAHRDFRQRVFGGGGVGTGAEGEAEA